MPTNSGSKMSALEILKYEPLPSSHHIRLLVLHPASTKEDELHCDLIPRSIDEKLVFEALSYVWGNPLPKKRVYCGGEYADIGPSLESALRHLRHTSKARVLWADALCINQADNGERSAQVQLMGDIYSMASGTIVWLGEDPDDRGSEIIQVIEKIGRNIDRLGKYEEFLEYTNRATESQRLLNWMTEVGLEFADWGTFGKLFEYPWFGRAWIIQELVLSKNPTIIFGNKSLDWNLIQRIVPVAAAFDVQTHWMLDVSKDITQNFDNADFLSGTRFWHHSGKNKVSFFQLVIRSSMFSCMQPRDVIISLLGFAVGLTPEEKGQLSDYECGLELFFARWMKIIAQQHGFGILPLNNIQPLSQRFRSWLPDIASLSVGTFESLRLYMGSFAASGQKVNIEISLDNFTFTKTGVCVDRVEKLGCVKGISSRDFKKVAEETEQDFMATVSKYVSSTISEAIGIAHGSNPAPGEEEEHALRKVLPVFFLDSKSRISEEYMPYCLHHMEILLDADMEEYKYWANSLSTTSKTNSIIQQSEKTSQAALNRWFGQTKEKRLGWMPLFAQPGDLICVFDGAQVPSVLRPSHDGQYKFIGDCYVDGLMEGEVDVMDGLVRQTFVLE